MGFGRKIDDEDETAKNINTNNLKEDYDNNSNFGAVEDIHFDAYAGLCVTSYED
ncbi:13267_t:CDS:2 [Funneliformis mosseae]|uniref:13267_t:CDS:1 n=1 Tax=Funneliformis mosseae TaxID=27381 RepID=A0A9N9CD95_FUNMO|nr:13267_t:CDS:2 [Funneliformis mosseae]